MSWSLTPTSGKTSSDRLCSQALGSGLVQLPDTHTHAHTKSNSHLTESSSVPSRNVLLTVWSWEVRRNCHSICSETEAKETEQMPNGSWSGWWRCEFPNFKITCYCISQPRITEDPVTYFRLNFKIEFYSFVRPSVSKPTSFFFYL